MSKRIKAMAAAGGLLAVGLAGGVTTAYAAGGGDDGRAQALQAKQRVAMSRITGPALTISPGGAGSTSVACPAGTLLSGGGHSTSGFDIYATDSFFSGNRWTIIAKNIGSAPQTVSAVARCLGGS